MPINLLKEQQKLRQIGEIRLGCVVPVNGTDRRGRPKTMPKKLDKFRFTSPSRPLLEKVALLYGGEVRAWTPQNGGPSEWELFSTVDRLPVLVRGYGDSDGGSATSEWFELYDGPRCVRKCDGEMEIISGQRCLCDPSGDLGWWDSRPCKPTTRLHVMLRDVQAIGNWLVVSRGRNAAETLPPMARFLANSDGYIPAALGIEERISYPAGDKPPNRFMVPILEVDLAPLELIAGRGAVQAALSSGEAAGPERKAIAAGSERPDYEKLAQDAPSADAAIQVYQAAERAGHLDEVLKAKLVAVGKAKRASESSAKPVGTATPEEEPAEAELVESSPEADRLWGLVVENTPDWTDERRKKEFAGRNEGLVPSSASEQQLGAFLQWLLNGGAR